MEESLIVAVLTGSLLVGAAVVPAAAVTANDVSGATTPVTSVVTLRVAPTYSEETTPSTGYVLPSSHWTTAAAEYTLKKEYEDKANGDPSTIPNLTTPAVWLRDPANHQNQTGVAGCYNLEVPDADEDGDLEGHEVLNAATDQGCITGWEAWRSDGDPFLVAVDGLWKSNETSSGWPEAWWQIQKNGHIAGDGISGVTLETGDELGLVRVRS